jgi:hypothetical protein
VAHPANRCQEEQACSERIKIIALGLETADFCACHGFLRGPGGEEEALRRAAGCRIGNSRPDAGPSNAVERVEPVRAAGIRVARLSQTERGAAYKASVSGAQLWPKINAFIYVYRVRVPRC